MSKGVAKDKLDRIYEFLKNNHDFNKHFQEYHYRSVIESRDTTSDKVILLLHRTASSQSQPKIDPLAEFLKVLHENKGKLSSFKGMLELLTNGQNNEPTYLNLYTALKARDGWGEKTAALFTKSIFHTHNGEYPNSLRFWRDAPYHICEDDRLYLPVDIVIKIVFRELGEKKPSFASINYMLSKNYSGDQVALWDDLWFWGTFTQKGKDSNRILEWNENKYWCNEGANKEDAYIKKLKSCAEEFMSLIQNRT